MSQTPVSLLDRLRDRPDEADWKRLHELYEPLIRGWLRRDATLRADADDLTQEVLLVVVRELPAFLRERPGSFRRWLREVTVHRLQAHWRSRQRRPGQAEEGVLAALADEGSALSRQWDEEHDRHVFDRLLAAVQPRVEAATWAAFRRVVLEGRGEAEVAAELGLSVNAVLLAKSRVLRRLREEGKGLVE